MWPIMSLWSNMAFILFWCFRKKGAQRKGETCKNDSKNPENDSKRHTSEFEDTLQETRTTPMTNFVIEDTITDTAPEAIQHAEIRKKEAQNLTIVTNTSDTEERRGKNNPFSKDLLFEHVESISYWLNDFQVHHPKKLSPSQRKATKCSKFKFIEKIPLSPHSIKRGYRLDLRSVENVLKSVKKRYSISDFKFIANVSQSPTSTKKKCFISKCLTPVQTTKTLLIGEQSSTKNITASRRKSAL